MSYQKVILVGNLGRDPEMRYLPNGNPVTNFNLATNRSYKNGNGERVNEVTWFRVSAWGRQAETCNQYLKVGSKVLIEGRLNPDAEGNPNTYERSDGTTGSSFEITAERVTFMDAKEDRTADVRQETFEEELDVPF